MIRRWIRSALGSLALGIALFGCSPASKDPDTTDASAADATIFTGPTGIVSGTVWAPGNAPGRAIPGQEIPIAGAIIYLTNAPPADIPAGVYCERCTNPTGSAFTTSNEKGRFVLGNILPGTYWISVQKGQFRRSTQVEVVAYQTIDLSTDASTLPSVNDPAGGKWIPKIALASGEYDHMEDILGKLGMGTIDPTGSFEANSQGSIFDVYSNGGAIDSVAMGTLTSLVSDIEKMKRYHIILIPCSGDDNQAALFNSAQVRENIREYVRLGGKLYVTDWSAEWEDVVFPAFVQLQNDGVRPNRVDTPEGATSASSFGNGDGEPPYESMRAHAVNQSLNRWLEGQTAPLVQINGFGANRYKEGLINPDGFVIEGAWDRIVDTPRQNVGTDDQGNPVFETAETFVMGDWNSSETAAIHPLTVTFEPVGCGRVLYSTYHTAENTHRGLVAQERVLLYLLMEIGVCKSRPIID